MFVMFDGRVFSTDRTDSRIPMGIKCVPHLAHLFPFSYEADFIQRFSRTIEKKITLSSYFTFRCIDDALSLYNSMFDDYVDGFDLIEPK